MCKREEGKMLLTPSAMARREASQSGAGRESRGISVDDDDDGSSGGDRMAGERGREAAGKEGDCVLSFSVGSSFSLFPSCGSALPLPGKGVHRDNRSH